MRITQNEEKQAKGIYCKRVREHLGLNQAEFSVQAGVSRNTVSGWETGRYEPTNHHWHRICELAGQPDAGGRPPSGKD